ncbi:MAG TPA: hypothetical protein VNT03_06780 [Baekduia sp.]|nr:hypothetical protein [Baekduia sp.]
MTTIERFTIGGRAASLALLRARIGRLPGLAVLDDPHATRRGPARLLIDVGGTGLTGYEIGRRMRRFSNVPLDFCREQRLVVVFDEGEEIAERGERLLFALAHACQAPVAPSWAEGLQ